MSLGSTKRNVSVAVVASALRMVVSTPLSLVVLPIAFHRLTPSQYGVWAVLSSVLAIAYFAEAGVRTEIVRRVADAYGREDLEGVVHAARQGWLVLSGLAALIGALGWLLSPFLVRLLLDDRDRLAAGVDVVLLSRITMLIFALSLVAAGAFAVLGGLQRTDWDSYGSIAGSVAGAAAVTGALLAGHGLWAFPLGSATYLLVESAVRLVGVRRLVPEMSWRVARVRRGVIQSYFGLSALVVLSQVSNVFDYEFDKVLLARIVGAGTAGHYDVGSTLTLQARAAALLPLVVLLPGVAELRHRDGAAVLRLYDGVVASVLAGVVAVLGGVYLFAPSFVPLWLGQGHEESITTAQLLAVAMVVNALAAPAAYYCIALGWTRLTAVGSLVNIVVNAVCSVVLVSFLGLHGVLIGSIAGNGAATIVFLALVRRRAPDVWRRGLARPLVVGALAVAAGSAVGLGEHAGSWLSFVGQASVWLAVAAVAAVVSDVPRRVAGAVSDR
jgi:O-antigen/teichoic acid export membrane protein